jgi:4-hydroxybenzoate polyprenyltransferase
MTHPASAVELREAAPRSRLAALAVSLRPRQWTKNGALLLPAIFGKRMTDPASVWLAVLGVVTFCLLASATYLGNDIADREQDRLHPDKRRRPIAAGDLPVGLAAVTAVALGALGLGIGFTLGPWFFACAVAYLALQVAYTLRLKRVVVLDVFAIAAGFVIRVIAGAEAVQVPVSNWLFLCTILLSLFLALSKRRAELTLLAGQAGLHRDILAEYTVPMVDQLLTVVSACTVLAYALYTLAPDTLQRFGTDRLKYTVPFVLFGLFRYHYLVHRQDAGGHPERVLLGDRPTQWNLVLYLAIVVWAVYTHNG